MPATTRHAYGDHPHQFADLHLPDHADGGPPLPVAALVHGGFWLQENGMDRMDGLVTDLVARGWAVWNVEYRRLGGTSGGGWPQTAQDVSLAIDHLATVTDAPLDLDSVISIGHSAGAQLTLLDAARRDARVPVAATVAQAPLTDVALAHAIGRGIEIIEAFMGGALADDAGGYAAASPVARVPLGTRQFVVHGEQDEMVPPQMVVDYVAAARAASDDVDFALRPGDGHFDHLDPESGAWADVIAWLATVVSVPSAPDARAAGRPGA